MIDVKKTKDTVLTFPGDIANAFPGDDKQKQIVAWLVSGAYREMFEHVALLNDAMAQSQGLDAEVVAVFQSIARNLRDSVRLWRDAQVAIEKFGHRGALE